MSRRSVLALSAALSAFVLVVVGAVASRALRPSPAPAASAAKADSVPADVVRAREAELRRLLDEANARLRARQTAAVTPAAADPGDGTASRAFEHEDDDDDGDHRPPARSEHRHERHEDDDG